MGSQALKGGKVRVEVQHFAILQTSSRLSTRFGEFHDGAMIFLGMVFILSIYLLAGAYMSHVAESETRLESFYSRATSWVMPRLEALQELLPCISTNLVGPSADMPLLVSVKALEERNKSKKSSPFAGWSSDLPGDVAWQFDIISTYGNKVLAVQQKQQDGQLGPVEVIGHRGSGRGQCLGSIDRKLQLFTGEGEDFGRLVRKQSGAYELKETASGRHRWLVHANMQFHGHEYFTVTWRPRRRLLATLNRGEGSHAEYMKVMPTQGVDVVLVVLCCIGLFVFRIDDDQAEVEAFPEEEDVAGYAGQLLAG